MISNNITIILYVTGIITASMLGVFLAPRLVFAKTLRVDVAYGGLPEVIERHWGMGIFITGLLLIWAGYDPAIRKPVLACVGLNKAVFVAMLLFDFKHKYVRNLALIMAFDAACVIIYAAYLMGWA
ncbi:MAG TPA: hypothetical protein PK344_06675 [Syntrophorhabdaceae bacterium]|nr:hypothetical protein [Syntrophorhabdaceae bacterium]HPA07223.1 hypothetical protein [Methanoregulaceae archaeon]